MLYKEIKQYSLHCFGLAFYYHSIFLDKLSLTSNLFPQFTYPWQSLKSHIIFFSQWKNKSRNKNIGIFGDQKQECIFKLKLIL